MQSMVNDYYTLLAAEEDHSVCELRKTLDIALE
jgi:hypothetical protein